MLKLLKLFYYPTVKRCLDVVMSGILIPLLTPLWLPILLILSIRFRGRPFFIQSRPGLQGAPFRIYKFRTLNNRKDLNGELAGDKERLTGIGALLRKSSLDELPQLINVLKGEMSLVGPRPLLMEYLPFYDAHQWQRHKVKPGITGLVQVRGRNHLNWEQKFELDAWYAGHQSLKLDLKILLLTVKVVLMAKGISCEGEFSSEIFPPKPPTSQKLPYKTGS